MPRGLAIGRSYVELAAGLYRNAGPIELDGSISLLGQPPQTIVQNAQFGPIFTVGLGANVDIEDLELSNARNDPNTANGIAIDCPNTPQGSRTMRLVRTRLAQNAGSAISAFACTVEIRESVVTGNGGDALRFTDSTVTIDRSDVSGNMGHAISLDGGLFHVTNSFVTRNGGGVSVYTTGLGSTVEFNTITDNRGTSFGDAGIDCISGSTAVSCANNIIARNAVATSGTDCTFAGTLVSTDVSTLHFKSPDTAPFDYHLTPGSVAIDAATLSTVDHDFDGDARPKGGGRDIGADEAQ